MVISISPKVFKMALNGDRRICQLIRNLLSLVERGRHELIFESTDYIEQIIDSAEFSSFREIIEMSMERSEERHSYQLLVRVTQRDILQINPDQSVSYFDGLKIVQEKANLRYEYIDVEVTEHYLGEKLRIYLENGRTDGMFLKEMYYLVTNEFLDEDRVDFRNCGGIRDVPNHLEEIQNPIRVICIVDSDKRFPDEPTNNDVLKIQEICSQSDYHFHVLKKRMIENYLPEKVLREWLGTKRYDLDHPYFQMTSEQKSYFNLKRGLFKEDLSDERVRELYLSRLEGTNWELMGAQEKIVPGFEKRIAQLLYKDLSTKCTLNDISPDAISELQQIAGLIDKYI